MHPCNQCSFSLSNSFCSCLENPLFRSVDEQEDRCPSFTMIAISLSDKRFYIFVIECTITRCFV